MALAGRCLLTPASFFRVARNYTACRHHPHPMNPLTPLTRSDAGTEWRANGQTVPAGASAGAGAGDPVFDEQRLVVESDAPGSLAASFRQVPVKTISDQADAGKRVLTELANFFKNKVAQEDETAGQTMRASRANI